VEWPDRRDGLKFTRGGSSDVRQAASGVRIMDGASLSCPGPVYNTGGFTVYVSSAGTDSTGTQGLITGPNFSTRFVGGNLEGLVTTNSNVTGTVSIGLSPTTSATVIHLNDVDRTEGHRLYANGSATAWGSRGRNSDASAGITLAPVKERYYRAIAIFNRAHSNSEMSEISAALESAAAVSEPPDHALIAQVNPWIYFSNVVSPYPSLYVENTWTVSTPDYCTYPQGGAE
jgi:hypothetical protein